MLLVQNDLGILRGIGEGNCTVTVYAMPFDDEVVLTGENEEYTEDAWETVPEKYVVSKTFNVTVGNNATSSKGNGDDTIDTGDFSKASGENSNTTTTVTTESTTETTTNKDGSTETTTNSQESSTEGTTIAPVEGAQVHNFTLNGTSSSFYTITGTLTSSYGSVNYNGLTLTKALKMESKTAVNFDPDGVAGTLTIVTNPQYSGTIELNDKAITIGSDGVATISLDGSQSYSITKGSGSNYIFYIAYTPNGSTPTVIKGDADDSGKVDAADVTMIMDFAVGKISAVTNATNADVTGDKTVDVDDAYKISQFLNGLIKSL